MNDEQVKRLSKATKKVREDSLGGYTQKPIVQKTPK